MNEISQASASLAKKDSPDIGRKASLALLLASLAIAYSLQVVNVKKMENNFDDRLLMQSGLLVIEGYHPFFGCYAMPAIWLWSAALNVEPVLSNFGSILKNARSGRMDEVFRIMARSREQAYLYPNKVINMLRYINALAAVGMVLFSYLIGARLTGRRWPGLVAAAIAMFSPLAIELGTIMNGDGYMALGVAATIYYSMAEAEEKRKRNWAWAATWLGFAASTKYVAIIFFPAITLAIWFGNENGWKTAVKRIITAGGILVAVYLILAPYILVDTSLFLKRLFIWNLYYYREGAATSLWRMTGFMVYALGYIAAVLAVVGVAAAAMRRSRSAIIILTCIAIYFAFLSTVSIVFSRYALTMLPLAAALASLGIVSLVKKIPPRLWKPATILLFIAALPLSSTITTLEARANGDTLTIARQWVYQNVPEGSRVVTTFMGPYIQYDKPSIQKWRRYFAAALVSSKAQLNLFQFDPGAVPLENLPTLDKTAEFPTEFFRDNMLNEERFFFKMFSYLDGVETLPRPGYDYFDLNNVPNNLTLLSGAKNYWVIVGKGFMQQTQPPGLPQVIAEHIKKFGKVVAYFSCEGKMGSDMVIYEVNLPEEEAVKP